MHEKLAGTRAYPLVDEHAAEQGTGIISVAANATKGLYHLPDRATDQPRVERSGMGRKTREGWLFLPSTEDARAAIQCLQGGMARRPGALAHGSRKSAANKSGFLSTNCRRWATRIKSSSCSRAAVSAGISIVIGFQNVAQLRAIYGRDRTVTMTQRSNHQGRTAVRRGRDCQVGERPSGRAARSNAPR